MKILFSIILMLLLHLYRLQAQQINSFDQLDSLSVLFYNVENLFDDIDDLNSGDDEFLSNGLRNWSSFRYKSKIKKISQVILASNKWEGPDLIGLSEIENRNVLNELSGNSLLNTIGYKILHKESSDHRGIDVGLLYNPQKISILDSAFYRLELSENTFSRDILYAKLKFLKDTLHVFVCHWPSRYSGALSSELNRMKASNLLLHQCVQIISKNSNSKILIMGDFNDEPNDKSLLNLTNNLMLNNKPLLSNLMDDEFELGTIKYKNQWYLFDQFIISNNLFKSKNGLRFLGIPQICSSSFLFIKDEKYLGNKPYRTFSGYKFIGGYSDHLPILIKLNYDHSNLEIPQ